MGSRPDITKDLSRALEFYLNPSHGPRIYIAKEVTFDYATDHRIRVDYIRFEPINNSVSGIEKGNFYCYEVKSSIEDFHSKYGHNFIGDYNYYVMTETVFDAVKSQVPHYAGVLVPYGNSLKSIKRAKQRSRERPVSELLLMMFRSVNREIYKKGGITCQN